MFGARADGVLPVLQGMYHSFTFCSHGHQWQNRMGKPWTRDKHRTPVQNIKLNEEW